MTNNAKVGGVLSIVAGAFGVLAMFLWMLVGILILVAGNIEGGYYYDTMRPETMMTIAAVFYFIMGIGSVILGALAIVGGVFALKRKYWGWALAGSIASVFTFFPCGIPAVIFTALGRPEFASNAPPAAPPAPMEKIVG
jgi:hypothetical protein